MPVLNRVGATVAVTVGAPDNDNIIAETDTGGYRITNIGISETLIIVSVTAEDRSTSRAYALAASRAASDDATLKSLELTVGELRFNANVANYEIDIPSGTEDLDATFETSHPAAKVVATFEHLDGQTVDALETNDGSLSVRALPIGQSVLNIAVTAEDSVSTKLYEVAVTTQSSSAMDHVALMWSLVAQDDLAGAYWISKSLANHGNASSQLPALLKAAHAARRFLPESKGFVGDLFNIVMETETPFDDDAQAMLGLAAAIQPSLVAPEANLFAWLVAPSCVSSLEGIVGPIRDFANLGHALGPEYVRGDEWHRRLEQLIVESSSRAREWLTDATKHRHTLARANNVWRHLCAEEGILGNMHKTVVSDVRPGVAKVRSDVEDLNQGSFIDEVIDDTDRTLNPNARNEIAGAARVWLNQRITEAVNIAADWCDLVEKANNSERGSQNQWLLDHVTELRSKIAAASEEIFEDLHRVSTCADKKDLAASARCLARSLHLLLLYMRVEHEGNVPSEAPQIVYDLQRVNQNAARHGLGDDVDIETALSRRLLWMPGVELEDDGTPSVPEHPVDLERATSDWFSGDAPLAQMVTSRVSAGDFRFLAILSPESTNGEPGDLENLFSPDLTTARETLQGHWDHTRAAVEQAVSDGVIEFEGMRWSELTNALVDIPVEQTRNFKRAHDTLDWIESTIENDRSVRRNELMTEWNPLLMDLQEDPTVESVVAADLSKTFTLASQRDSLDIRIMEDCVSRVRNHTSGDGQDLLPVRLESHSTALEDFLTFSEIAVDSQSFSGAGNTLRTLLRRSDSRIQGTV